MAEDQQIRAITPEQRKASSALIGTTLARVLSTRIEPQRFKTVSTEPISEYAIKQNINTDENLLRETYFRDQVASSITLSLSFLTFDQLVKLADRVHDLLNE